MRSRKNNKLVSTVALVLVIVMALSVLLGSLATMVSAASSSALKSKLGDLKDQAAEIAAKADALDKEIAANQSETQSIVDKKAGIDQKMELTRQEIANLNEQITQYNLLIASKQEELDEALAQEEQMNETYQVRLRAMEENGSISYWSILFGASSFTDLLDRVDMISEIAQSDINMIEQMKAVAQAIAAARQELQDSKQELELSKLELADLEQELALERAEADQLITQLMAKSEELIAASKEYDTMEDELRQQILSVQTQYENALQDEEAARKIQQARENAASGNLPAASSSSSGFQFPLPSGSAYVSCAYGYRYHPIYGYYAMHSGVDLAASSGTPIYATKSGTVTMADYSSVNGYYVTINHGDGYSSLYAHMTNYIVSSGQTVTKGQIIGYVGTSGWSTGPHLHFEIYYGGSTVNPMDYVSVS